MLSVVIPVKNEPYLPQLLSLLPSDCEVHIQTEQGLGYAVLCGVRASIGDVVAVLDGDGSHNPKYLSQMVSLLGDCDVVVGSRYFGGSTCDPQVRQLLSRLYCLFAQFLFRLQVRDCMSGYIVAKKSVYDCLVLNPVGYKFGLELLVKAQGKFKVKECPVVFERRKMGASKTGFGQGIKTLAFMIKLYVEKQAGYYR